MSETPMDPTETGQEDDELQPGRHGEVREAADAMTPDADGGADAGAGPVSDLSEGDDVSAGTDGIGGGNDSRSSVLEDTLGAGGDPDEVDDDR